MATFVSFAIITYLKSYKLIGGYSICFVIVQTTVQRLTVVVGRSQPRPRSVLRLQIA